MPKRGSCNDTQAEACDYLLCRQEENVNIETRGEIVPIDIYLLLKYAKFYSAVLCPTRFGLVACHGLVLTVATSDKPTCLYTM